MQVAEVLIIMGLVIIVFAFELIPLELIGLLVMLALTILGILPADQIFASFGNPAIIMIAGIMVMTGGLIHNGVADHLSRKMNQLAGESEKGITMLLFSATAAVSAFINNVAATAMFIPVAEWVSKRYRMNPSKYLLPIAYASLLGGVCTLIGTSTNVAISGALEDYHMKSFTMFELTPVGITLAIFGLVYLFFISDRLLPRKRVSDKAEEFHIKEYLFEIIVHDDSPYSGKRIADIDFIKKANLTVVGIVRGNEKMLSPSEREVIHGGDLLFLEGDIGKILQVKGIEGIEIKSDIKISGNEIESEKVKMVEATISYNSPFIGKTLKELNFRNRYGVNVLAIYRRGESLVEKVGKIKLKLGDVLLVLGLEENFFRLWKEPNMLLMEDVILPKYNRNRAVLSLVIFTLVVFVSALGLFSAPILFLSGATLMILFRTLRMQEAYQYLNMRILFMIAGMISLAKAMEITGTALFLAGIAVDAFGSYGPIFLLGTFFLMTVLLTQPISNAAAALLMLPIAINAAKLSGVDERPFVIAITVAASCSFITPLEPACLLVFSAGRYKFLDFLKVGLPLTLIAFVISMILIPRLWSF
ncbi:MAG: SLC13 family permease [Acidobacteriota bacterium]